MQKALTPYMRTEHKGQAALWVTNGWTSMSKPMGVDNDAYISQQSFKSRD